MFQSILRRCSAGLVRDDGHAGFVTPARVPVEDGPIHWRSLPAPVLVGLIKRPVSPQHAEYTQWNQIPSGPNRMLPDQKWTDRHHCRPSVPLEVLANDNSEAAEIDAALGPHSTYDVRCQSTTQFGTRCCWR